jgi:hypothetical protein
VFPQTLYWRGSCQPHLSLLTDHDRDSGFGSRCYQPIRIDDIDFSRRSLCIVLAIALEIVAFCVRSPFCEQAQCWRKTKVEMMPVITSTFELLDAIPIWSESSYVVCRFLHACALRHG